MGKVLYPNLNKQNIIQEYAAGFAPEQIAEKYGISKIYVYKIIGGCSGRRAIRKRRANKNNFCGMRSAKVDRNNAILADYANKVPMVEIAKKHKVTYKVVNYVVYRYGNKQ